jgi:MFS family permease
MQQDSLVEYGARRAIVTITAIFCALLEIVDTTIVNVALNDMKGNLGATLNEIGWVITAYAIGNVIIVPMTSWLSRHEITLLHPSYCLPFVLFSAEMPPRCGSSSYSASCRD